MQMPGRSDLLAAKGGKLISVRRLVQLGLLNNSDYIFDVRGTLVSSIIWGMPDGMLASYNNIVSNISYYLQMGHIAFYSIWSQ